jgi:hypothetical protein
MAEIDEDRGYIFDLIDKCLRECSTFGMMQQIENSLKEFFNCERVTVVMVHRFKKYFYRIENIKGTQTMKQYDINQGFAGFIA